MGCVQDVFYARRDIAYKKGKWDFEVIEDCINPSIGISAPGRNVIGFALSMLI